MWPTAAVFATHQNNTFVLSTDLTSEAQHLRDVVSTPA